MAMPHYAPSGQPVKAEQQAPLLPRWRPMHQTRAFVALPLFTFEHRHIASLQVLNVIHRKYCCV